MNSLPILLIYFIMIPFLHPRGFDEYFSVYSLFFKAWQYLDIVLIFATIVFSLKDKHKLTLYIGALLFYYIGLFCITLLRRHTFEEGIQKIFLIPFIVLFTYKELKDHPSMFIHAVNNIIAINFLLNLTVFSPLIWKQYFKPMENHLTFLGHVQVCAQVGILSFLFLYLEYHLYQDQKKKKRFFFRVMLTLLTMLTAFTSAAYISIGLIILFYLLDKTSIRRIFVYRGRIYIAGFLLLNLFFMLYVSFISIDMTFGPISMSGRGFIWVEALKLIRQSPVWGYGVHGVLVKVFWHQWMTGAKGMNYMHNQVLQVLCDGGILLLIPFILMLFGATSSIDKIKDGELRFWVVVCIMVMLIIMTFESSLEYLYGHMILATCAALPVFSSDINIKIRNYLLCRKH